ncbi:MAG: CoA transferase, partial [Candidatus Eremiobacteraeota bacterium]|nr:CoA transferase [Candidatus Eremiobacteraeota bacterium]
RYADFSGRRKHREELQGIIGPIVASKTSRAWIEHFTAMGVPCGPVNSIPEALADLQTSARGMIVEYEQPTLGQVRSIASPVKVGSEAPAARRAPLRNENAEEILRDLLRYDEATVARLTESGAFGEVAVAEAAVGPLL